MSSWIGKRREARRCYGFDEIALVPSSITINPEEVDTSWSLPVPRTCGDGRDYKFEVPIIAAAMDGVVDTRFAIEMGKLGGLAILNLEGVQTRYENPEEVIEKIVSSSDREATYLVQQIYEEPIKDELVEKRIKEIKSAGVPAIVSAVPQNASHLGKIAEAAGADIFVVQSTVLTVKHISTKYSPVDLKKFCREMRIPVILGNCVTYEVAMELMEAGASAVLVGIGPGAACTTRGVLGIGVPQVTATSDVAAARDFYYKQTGRYIPVITDGGMRRGGDLCKAIACGADAVVIGSILARAKEAPGKGYHWGMATPHPNLPRGTRIHVGTTGTLKEILFGPARTDDGSQNLIGALQTSMGNLGARNIKEMQLSTIIIAPSIQTEGKIFQSVQRVGMWK
ncbi:MAG TPA: GuaB3 family IMP dehydrogenase-related protein [Candidatus Omnitrophica bacterium]|nr:GuaB3 family IMP dehydrogenase-related protein [Candidatus Omnitrophota bacterium]